MLLTAWTDTDCLGNSSGSSTFPDHASIRELNVSNFDVYQSLRLNRSLLGQEQLDISVASDLDNWYSNKDQYSVSSASCDIFLMSFTTQSNLTRCFNVPKFTCHRIWQNAGLQIGV